MRFSKHLAVTAVVAVVGGIAAPGIAAARTAPSWVIQATPSPNIRQGSVLLGVSCSSATTCTAVGGYAPSPGAIVTLAERWSGRDWVVLRTPRVQNGALSGGVLYGVSCLSASACTAVGYGPKETLAEHWNGRKWAIQPTPNPSVTKDIMLRSVSCTSAKACTAVGSYGAGAGSTLAERWNGRKWAIQPTPNPVTGTDGSELHAVSCTSATSCTAVGDSNTSGSRSDTLIEHWNGTKWTVQPTPEPPSGHESTLTGVSCPSAHACTAVGDYDTRTADLTLAERWNGRKWVVQPTPNPSGFTGSELAKVSCPSATDCTAAGDYDNRSETDLTLAEHWNGTRWTVQPTPNPSSSNDGLAILFGVSCSSDTACTAVGAYLKKHGAEPTLAERYS